MILLCLCLSLLKAANAFDCSNPPADYTTLAFGHYWKLTGYMRYNESEAECANDGTRLAMLDDWHLTRWILRKYKCKFQPMWVHNLVTTPYSFHRQWSPKDLDHQGLVWSRGNYRQFCLVWQLQHAVARWCQHQVQALSLDTRRCPPEGNTNWVFYIFNCWQGELPQCRFKRFLTCSMYINPILPHIGVFNISGWMSRLAAASRSLPIQVHSAVNYFWLCQPSVQLPVPHGTLLEADRHISEELWGCYERVRKWWNTSSTHLKQCGAGMDLKHLFG